MPYDFGAIEPKWQKKWAESKIFESMAPGELSSTWGGNPMASAATLAVLDAMENEKLPENARVMGEYLKPLLLDLKQKFTCIGDVRGKGLVIGLEIVQPDDGFTPASKLTGKIIRAGAERGLLMGKVGIYGNVIRVAPPLVINKEEIDIAVEILEESIAAAMD